MENNNLGAPPAVFFRPAQLEDLDAIASLEAASYPADEAATREKLDYRLREAGDLFLVAVSSQNDSQIYGDNFSDNLIGFCCGTLSTSGTLTHESMELHEDDGTLLCIHSVCVAEERRRGGIASRLLRAYTLFVQQTRPELKDIRLICKDNLVPLYSKAGFEVVGPSPVVHGSDPWIEMSLALE